MKIRFMIFSLIAVILVACSSNPVSEADTFEQRAYALYGTFVIYQGKAADLYKDPSMPESAKRALSQTDAIAYPIAESLVNAATVVTDVRELIEKCQTDPVVEARESCKNTSEEKLNIALMNLSKIYFEAKPKLLAVKTTFDTIKRAN